MIYKIYNLLIYDCTIAHKNLWQSMITIILHKSRNLTTQFDKSRALL